MISFFRIFDPLRLIVLVLLFLAFRLPMLVKGVPLIAPELSWMLVGEKMSDGALLYKDIWYQLEPFSAAIYYMIDLLFGKSQLAYQVINLILVFCQALVFTLILNFNNVYNERSYIPSLLYLMFSFLFFDFTTLSPVILGTTLLLPALNLLLIQLRTKEKKEMMLALGILSGIASLFYMPLSFFVIFVLIVFVLYIHPQVRMYFTLFTGFLIPYMFVCCYYFICGGLGGFYMSMVQPFFRMSEHPHLSAWHLFVVLLPAAIIAACALFVVFSNSKYINYQYLVIKAMGIWLLVSAVSLLFMKNAEPFHLFIFVPPLSLIASHYFLILKNGWIKEFSFISLAAAILLINYGNIYGFFKKRTINYESLVLTKPAAYAQYEGKKMLVIGEAPGAYIGNSLATPYYNWDLSSRQLTSLDNYYNISEVYLNFRKDLPEVIIDQKNLVPRLFYKIPALSKEYVRTGSNTYLRKADLPGLH